MLIIEDLDVMAAATETAAAPPLPPRNSINSSQFHRPLERSWPPRISRNNKPNANDTFTFDIIDTDEPVVGTTDEACDAERVDFIPGEFFEERRYAGDGQAHRTIRDDLAAPLATPETDGSISESNVLRLGGMPKTPETVKLKPLMKKKIGPDNYISTILTQKISQSTTPAASNSKDYTFPLTNSSGDQPTTSDPPVTVNCNNLIGEFIPLRPHRPLTRQLSNGSSSTKRNALQERASCSNPKTVSADDEVNRHFALCRKPPLRSPRQRSPPSGSSTRSASPMTMEQATSSPEGAASPHAPISSSKLAAKPQPRQLNQVNATDTNEHLVCPPTPTHHARRLRSLSVSLGPPELRSRDMFTHERSSSLDSRQIDIFEPPPALMSRPASEFRETGEGDDATHMHISSTRLPSIPESARTAVANDEPLPSAWEARMDSHGRIFYIDHTTRSTSWQRPGGSGILVGSSGRDQHRQQLDRRYQSIRRTINRRNDPNYSTLLPSQGRDISSGGVVADNGTRANELSCGVAESDSHPAIKMLCRPDFYSKLHTNEEALSVYNRNAALKHMILRIRRDTSCFERYQYNKDLVALVNCFALIDRDLPIGWETKLDATGKQFFIDHSNRKTSFMDPRLPIDCPRIRHLQQQICESQYDIAPIPPPRPALMPRPPNASPEIPIAYNDKVIEIRICGNEPVSSISHFTCRSWHSLDSQIFWKYSKNAMASQPYPDRCVKKSTQFELKERRHSNVSVMIFNWPFCWGECRHFNFTHDHVILHSSEKWEFLLTDNLSYVDSNRKIIPFTISHVFDGKWVLPHSEIIKEKCAKKCIGWNVLFVRHSTYVSSDTRFTHFMCEYLNSVLVATAVAVVVLAFSLVGTVCVTQVYLLPV